MSNISKQDTLKFLRSVNVMSAAVCIDGKPISTVLLFTTDNNFVLNFATHKNSFKSKALLKNNKISYNVWEHKQMLVQADGFVEQVTDESEINTALDNLTKSVSNIQDFWPPVLQITGDDYIVFKLTTTWLRVLDLSDSKIHKNGEQFIQII